MPRPRLVLCALPAAMVLLGTEAARADDQACPPLVIEASSSIGVRWPELVPSARAALSQRENIDRCARVRLLSAKDAIGVEVALTDGRVALRSVAGPEDVVPTLEALLLLPGHEEHSTAAREDAPPEAPAPESSASSAPEPRPARDRRVSVNGRPRAAKEDVAASPQPQNAVRVELSAATGARFGDGQASLGLGLLSFLELSGWLVGFEGRIDRYHLLEVTRPVSSSLASPPPESVSGALELGVLVGRRVPLGSLAFDVVLGPAAALQGTSTVQTQAGADSSQQSSSSTVPRLLVMSRLTWGSHAIFRGFIGIDGEAGAARSSGAEMPSAPRLPRWTLGLALGATVGSP
jgi:hypothetical protein